MNKRNTLPKMCEISNNSRLTQELAETINNKLTDQELANFHRWIGIVKTERNERSSVRNQISNALKRNGY
jgi:hypothetical protein